MINLGLLSYWVIGYLVIWLLGYLVIGLLVIWLLGYLVIGSELLLPRRLLFRIFDNEKLNLNVNISNRSLVIRH